MKRNNTNSNDIFLIDLNIISSVVFILTSLISLALTFDEKNNIMGKKKYFSNKSALNISFYNRIIILLAVLVSLYVGYENYSSEKEKEAKYKSSLLVFTNILSVIGAIVILYVSYLNRNEQSITVSDIENPLI